MLRWSRSNRLWQPIGLLPSPCSSRVFFGALANMALENPGKVRRVGESGCVRNRRHRRVLLLQHLAGLFEPLSHHEVPIGDAEVFPERAAKRESTHAAS